MEMSQKHSYSNPVVFDNPIFIGNVPRNISTLLPINNGFTGNIKDLKINHERYVTQPGSIAQLVLKKFKFSW